jgi:hypothetical protein
MRVVLGIFAAIALSGCAGPPAAQVIGTLKTALDTRCVTARLLDMDDICPRPGDPGPEPARYCYRTLGEVDCYAAPEAEARRRNVVVASPAIAPPED